VASGASVPAVLTFDPATGAVSVKPGTPAGTYHFDYTICEKLNPTNCATATASVTVVAAPIVATNDTVPPVNGGQGGAGVIDVLGNDTLNGAPADKGTVTISVVTPATPINGAPCRCSIRPRAWSACRRIPRRALTPSTIASARS
jgi:hypothetical protein